MKIGSSYLREWKYTYACVVKLRDVFENKETRCKVTDCAICNFVLIVNGSGKLLSLFIVTSLIEPFTGVTVKSTGLPVPVVVCVCVCVCYRCEQDTLWFHGASVHLCLYLLFSGAASRTKCNAGPRKLKRFTGKSEYEVVNKKWLLSYCRLVHGFVRKYFSSMRFYFWLIIFVF